MATLHLKKGFARSAVAKPKLAASWRGAGMSKPTKTIGKLGTFRAAPKVSKYRVTSKLASYRKPGWSDEARAAAYASRMAKARGYKALVAGGRYAANLHHLRIGRVAALVNAGPKVRRIKKKVAKGSVLVSFGTAKNKYTKQVVRAVRAGKSLPAYRMPKPKESRLRLSTRAKAPPVSGKRRLYKGI